MVFTIQRNRLTDRLCIFLNIMTILSLILIALSSIAGVSVGTPGDAYSQLIASASGADIPDGVLKAIYDLVLGVSELTYIMFFSAWCAYMFYQCGVDSFNTTQSTLFALTQKDSIKVPYGP
jgi:hypothetical protein